MIDGSPKTVAKIIDEIERIREDLLVIQRALEKREAATSSRSNTDGGTSRRLKNNNECAGATPHGAPDTVEAAARFVATVVGDELVETLAQVGHDGRDSLRALALGRAGTLYRRWPHRDRQQRRRTLFARGGPGSEELLVCGIGCRRRTRRGDVQPDWLSETQ